MIKDTVKDTTKDIEKVKNPVFLYILFSILLLAVVFLSLNIGRYPVTVIDAFNIMLNKFGFGVGNVESSLEKGIVFWHIRIPRILLGICVGAALSVSGAVMQALFKNPLASPDIIGVTQGASFGAAFAFMCLPQVPIVIRISSFLFGFLAILLCFFLAERVQDSSITVLVLIGIILSALFQAGLSLIIYFSDPYDQMQKITYWIMGSLQSAAWKNLIYSIPPILIGVVVLVLLSWRLNVMAQSDEEAMSLGINVFFWRYFYLAVSAITISASASICGNIGWVGLIIPHIARMLVGPEHKRLMPLTALLGASFLLLIDTIIRSLSTGEIPISIATSLVGAPFLGYLVMRSRKEAREWR